MASKRQYVTIAEVEQYADITSTDDSEFEDRISQCEEIIDAYVGPQQKFVGQEFHGKLTSVNGATLIDNSSDTQLNLQDNYFSYCNIEIIGGTGAGQRGRIASSSQDGYSVTLATAFDTLPNSTSIYKIYQLGKFPRLEDHWYEPDSTTYYKSIPEAVKRATAAQLEYMVAQGDKFFQSDSADLESEHIDTYSYSKGSGGGSSMALVKMIAPKARALLKGITNRTGQIIPENPTEL